MNGADTSIDMRDQPIHAETPMNLQPYVKQAGPYPISFVKCPFYSVPVDLNASRAGVLHTTEGGFVGSEGVFVRHWAPHFLLGLDGGVPKIHQLVPLGYIGAALEKHNDLALVQIEMVGYSKECAWLPDAKTLDILAHLMVTLEADYGIPLSHPWPDDDWCRAGYDTPHRLSGKFGHVAGWYAHGDVPQNNHWDCGHLEWSKVFAYAERIKQAQPALRVEQGYRPWQVERAKAIFDFFNGKVVSPASSATPPVVLKPFHAAAFVEMADAESSFTLAPWGDGGVSYGLWQLSGKRLRDACAAVHAPVPTPSNNAVIPLEQQLEMAWFDINSPSEVSCYHALEHLLETKNAFDAAGVLTTRWERAGAPGQVAKRGAGATKWLNQFSQSSA